ncbi:fasciclin-like arabinogalactan protein 1 [Phtheirospermum japonicum]|uniref:Fasciclin-like arabinogalactan protein 1 n=1 Tax=Phtheirospermum japonicum TaxID=374723 RepID=A0A830C9V9_9LAMI|nr:fasciclin-like arabinogalactan protein 1 [Phtheirospermum japonicum]
MSAHGCKVFAETLLANPDTAEMFESNVESGLMISSPSDTAMKGFMPKFQKHNRLLDKQSMLEYHEIPIYESMSTLKSRKWIERTRWPPTVPESSIPWCRMTVPT